MTLGIGLALVRPLRKEPHVSGVGDAGMQAEGPTLEADCGYSF